MKSCCFASFCGVGACVFVRIYADEPCLTVPQHLARQEERVPAGMHDSSLGAAHQLTPSVSSRAEGLGMRVCGGAQLRRNVSGSYISVMCLIVHLQVFRTQMFSTMFTDAGAFCSENLTLDTVPLVEVEEGRREKEHSLKMGTASVRKSVT